MKQQHLKVPSHWKVLALARICLSKCDGPFGSSIKSENYVAAGVRVIRLQNIGAGEFRDADAAYLDEDYVRTRIGDGHWVEPNDVLMAGLGDENNPLGRTCVAPPGLGRAIVKADCYRLRLDNTRAEPAFVSLQLASTSVAECGAMATGSTRQRLNLGLATARVVALPPTLEEQRAIVAWSEREAARIGALIEKKTRFIELLREKRQAQITNWVTRGLDAHASLQHTKHSYLQAIPSHWTVKRLKYLSDGLTVGIVVNPSEYVADEGLPFIYGGDISEDGLDLVGCRRIAVEQSNANAKTRLRAGDLVTVRVGEPGVTAVVPPEGEGGNCASVMLIRKGEFDSDWLCFVMNSRIVRHQVEVVQYGAAQEQFNIGHAVDFFLPLPPIHEQRQIANMSKAYVARVGALCRQTQRSIDLLRERRSALITAAVTGQIDVRAEHPAEDLEPA